MKRFATLVTTILVLCTLSGCAGMAEAKYKRRWQTKPAPDFELTSLDGTKVRLSGFIGKPVLLTFWGHG